MGARSERRGGQYGNARGIPDKQVRRRRMRESDPRYQAAMAEVREQNEIIDRLAAQDPADAAASAEARRRMPLLYVKPEVAVPEPTPETPRTPAVADGGRRFVPCHCGHDRPSHQNPKAAPSCVQCDCPGYRPNTAPDPLDPDAPKIKGADSIIARAKASSAKATRTKAERIEGLLIALEEIVDAEEEKARLEREELERTREARERVERLERELAEAKAQLGTARKKKPNVFKAAAASTSTSSNYERDENGNYICPDCGDTKGTPQGIGAHRARKHGYRKGDDA